MIWYIAEIESIGDKQSCSILGGAGVAEYVCPWWIGYFLVNPLRRFVHNPKKLFTPYIRCGMMVLELGPGMGFFTIDLARLAGPDGKVIAVDVQSRMLDAVRNRASKAGLADRIETRLAGEGDSWARDLMGKVDFALAIFMLHEVPDLERYLRTIRRTLRSRGNLLIAEPKAHVSTGRYTETLRAAQKAGFLIADHPRMFLARAALLSVL
jgi:ubiquinone/menaquinone biosynthesis C-methylase UbiE